MRYALRNQPKIAKAYSPDMLKRIIDSLNSHFEKSETIELYQSNEKYPLLVITDTGHTVNVIAFYVLEIKFDVYRLAFKEFIG